MPIESRVQPPQPNRFMSLTTAWIRHASVNCALACVLAIGLHVPAARAASPAESAGSLLQSGAAGASQPRYELGAIVDVRQASAEGIVVLAVTPGSAADRMGLLAGDRLHAINGRRLDATAKPSAAFDSALQESDGLLQIEISRNGKAMSLTGQADTVAAIGPVGCGYVTDREGIVPRSQGIFDSEITQVDGRSTPLQTSNRHRVGAGKRVLVVRELIPETYLNSAQLLQIAKMKKFAFARAYKSLVVDVKPGMSYRIGARLLRDRLDTQGIRDNAYWEPVVWAQVPQACP